MQRIVTAVAMAALLAAGSPALAAEPANNLSILATHIENHVADLRTSCTLLQKESIRVTLENVLTVATVSEYSNPIYAVSQMQKVLESDAPAVRAARTHCRTLFPQVLASSNGEEIPF